MYLKLKILLSCLKYLFGLAEWNKVSVDGRITGDEYELWGYCNGPCVWDTEGYFDVLGLMAQFQGRPDNSPESDCMALLRSPRGRSRGRALVTYLWPQGGVW